LSLIGNYIQVPLLLLCRSKRANTHTNTQTHTHKGKQSSVLTLIQALTYALHKLIPLSAVALKLI